MSKLAKAIRTGLPALVILFVMNALHVSSVMAEDTLPAIAGITQGTGTSFSVTDSDYLNVSIDSTAEIDLYVNSFPMMVEMTIAASTGATSADITVGGLEANTTYWMYQDDNVDGVEFTTDNSGSYDFKLDITKPRYIWIQPEKSTIYIFDDGTIGHGGDCTSVGVWDSFTNTCTLNQTVNDTIFIYDPLGTHVGVTLDGSGNQITNGHVRVLGSNHTIKNLTINGSIDPTYQLPTGQGLLLTHTKTLTVTNVTVSTVYRGISIYNTSNSMITNNSFTNVMHGAHISAANYNQSSCDSGNIARCGTRSNTIKDNVFSHYSTHSSPYNYIGMFLLYGVKDNNITGNTISNFDSGFAITEAGCRNGLTRDDCSSGNVVYQNNFLNNYPYQVFVNYRYGDTTFNLLEPDGGNYFSDFDEPVEGCGDSNHDGFCDTPYTIYNTSNVDIFDNLPWTSLDGWVNQPPLADPNGPYLVAVGGQIMLDGSASSDPDGDALAEIWTAAYGGTVVGNIYTAGDVPGIYDVTLVVNDGTVDSEPAETTVVVYDPAGGFVTGGGWIDSPEGAYTADPLSTGKANFGFVSKYKKGATTPTGETQFQFSAGDLNFHSDTYQWLVVNQGGKNAQYKGTGTINDGLAPAGEAYNFMLWANDGDNTNSVEPDTFRIQVWYVDDYDNDVVVYDNGFDQEVSGGSIVIHTGK